MIEGKAYYISFTEVQRGSFEIHELSQDPAPGEPVPIGHWSLRYVADGPLAGDLAAKGMILLLWKEEKVVGIAYHPDDREQMLSSDL